VGEGIKRPCFTLFLSVYLSKFSYLLPNEKKSQFVSQEGWGKWGKKRKDHGSFLVIFENWGSPLIVNG
jgi:hypothetical protein